MLEGNLTRNYTVTWIPVSSANVGNNSGVIGTSTTITGLKSNTAYSFTVTAVNEAGSGEASNATLMQTSNKILYHFYNLPGLILYYNLSGLIPNFY